MVCWDYPATNQELWDFSGSYLIQSSYWIGTWSVRCQESSPVMVVHGLAHSKSIEITEDCWDLKQALGLLTLTHSTGEWSFLNSVTLLRRYFEHCAGGIYAISLVGCFLSAQGATFYTGAYDGACKATTCGLGGAFVCGLVFFQDILLLSYLS